MRMVVAALIRSLPPATVAPVTLLAVALAMPMGLHAAVGDPVGPSIRLGGSAHDPFFMDFDDIYGVAELSNGNIVVGWETRDRGTTPSPDGNDQGAFFQVISPTGTAVTGAITPYGDINPSGTGEQNTPLVAALTGGGFAIMWDSNGGPGDIGPTGDVADTYVRVFDNSGNPVAATQKVNDSTADEELPAAIIPLSSGGFAVVWKDDNELPATPDDNLDDYYVRLFNSSGTPVNSSIRLGGSAHDPFFMDFDDIYGIAELSNGNIVVGWETRDRGTTPSPDGNDQGAFFQVISPTGTAVTGAITPYGDINPSGTGEQNTPLVAALTGGGFAIMWDSNGGPGDIGPTGDVADTYVRVFDNSGNPVAATQKVNDSTADEELPAAIIPLSSGGFAVVWKDDNELPATPDDNLDDYYVRLFNSSGTPVNSSIRLGGSAHDPFFMDFDDIYGIAELSNGNIVVGWETRDRGTTPSPDGNDQGAFFQVISPTGTAVTGAITPYGDINPSGTGEQNTPLLAALTGGGFAIMWDSNGGPGDIGPTGDVADTYVRVFTNTGTAVAGTKKVNDSTADEELPAAIIPLGSGGFAIVWKDDNELPATPDDNLDDYYLRVFEGTPTVTNVDIQVTAAESGDPIVAGAGNLVYTITATNAGPSAATGVALSNVLTLPAGVSLSNTSTSSGTYSGGANGTWSVGSLAASASETLTVTLTVASNTAAGTGVVGVNASVSAVSETDTDNSNDSASETTSVTRQVDIQLGKTESIDPVVAGSGTGNLVYVVTATNAGPSDATGLAVSETITTPTGVTVNSIVPSGSTTYAAGTWTIGALASGASASLTVTLTVDASAAGGTDVISDTATVTSVNETDSNSANNTVTESTSIAREVDLQIATVESVDPVVAGSGTGNLTYTITVTNGGPSGASGLSLTEMVTLPTGVTIESAVASAGTTYPGGANGTWTIGDLAPSASATLAFTLTADSTAQSGVDVVAVSSTVSALAETNTGDTSSSESTSVTREVSLGLTKVESIDPVLAGSGAGNLVYTMTVTNNGPSDASGLTLSESVTLPTGVTIDSIVASTGTYAPPNDANGTWTLGTLAASASETLTVTLTVDGSAEAGTDVISDTLTVTAVNETNTGDTSVTESTSVTREIQLTLSTLESADPVVAGSGPGNLVYTVTVSNAGPSNASGLELSEALTLPSGTTVVSIVPSTGSYAPPNDPNGTWTVGDLAASASETLTITLTVDATTTVGTDVVTSTVSVSAVQETNTGDTSSSESTSVERQVDLVVAVAESADPVTAGSGSGNLVHTVTLTNSGPSDATSVDVTANLTLPTGVTRDTVVASTGSFVDGAAPDGSWTLDLASGQSATLVVTFTADATTAPASDAVATSATVSAANEPLINTGDDSGTEATSVAASADLGITISDAPDPVIAGTDVTYTVRVDNGGPSDATDVVVTTTLPPGTSLSSTAGCAEDPSGTPSCSLGTVPAGGFSEFTVVAAVDPSTRGLITATVGVASPIDDANATNDTASAQTTVDAEVDLWLVKTDDVDPVPSGSTLTYTLTVTNDGPSDATNVVVTDTLPTAVSLVSTSGCAEDPSAVPTCTLGTVVAGGMAQYTVTVSIDPAPPTSIVNTASVSATETDTDPSNNSDDEETGLDAISPQVVAFTSSPDSGDGSLDECETATVAITEIVLEFSETMADPIGDADINDVTNPSNYLVVGAGPNGDIDTTACGSALADDVVIPIAGVSYAAPTATLDTGTLPRSRIRVFACDDLEDLAGNPLDGDADGTGGDSFVRTFRSDPFNRFANGHFDCEANGLVPWQLSDPVEITYATEDSVGASQSGSSQVMQLAANTSFTMDVCVPVSSDDTSITGNVRLDAPGPFTFISMTAGCEYFAGAGCGTPGSGLSEDVTTDLLSDTGGAWVMFNSPLMIPHGVTSARCGFTFATPSGDDFTAWLDGLTLINQGPLFADGFESGDTSAWSTTEP
jgi:uncharacterized repeat protein (TIGR01451 family)